MLVKMGSANASPGFVKAQALSHPVVPGTVKAELFHRACLRGCPLLQLCKELESFPLRVTSSDSCWKRLFSQHNRIALFLRKRILQNFSDEVRTSSMQNRGIQASLGKQGRGRELREKSNRHHQDLLGVDTDWKVVSREGNEKSWQQGNESTDSSDQSFSNKKFHPDLSKSGPHHIFTANTRKRREDARETSIPHYVIRELLKIAKLGLSEDLKEGDAGHKVLLLQRAMLLLGYLPDVASLTGYFGLETRTAVEEFQKAYQVSSTGLWDSLSRQALLKYLACFKEENSNKTTRQGVLPSSNDHAKKGFQAGIKCLQTVQEPIRELPELFAPISCYGNTLYGRFCVGALGLIAFVSVIRIGHSSRMSQGQAVKKRILRSRWYTEGKNGVDRRRLLRGAKGQRLRVAFPRSSQKNPHGGREDTHRYKGLVIHDGELVQNGFGGGMQNGFYLKHDQEASTYQSDYNSRSSAAFFLASLDKSYKSEVPHHGGEASEENQTTASDNNLDSNSEQSHKSFLEKVGCFISDAFLSSKTHSMPDSIKSFPDVRDVAQGFAEKQIICPNTQEAIVEPRMPSGRASMMTGLHGRWKKEDELYLKDHLEELRKTVLAAEENRKATMRALADEKRRSLELEVKIRRQKEAAAALEEEVRVLKESHDTLLQSLRKKYSSSVSARAAAALLYQNWETNGDDGAHREPL
ncbi:hypothetical protein O6H91_17G039800 [Diphasiastrum complanatum]|uniref:Uncharacterized protein n=1 Tax=Diphasiastrum complanatum TaxID=34168 RepID=A0ACC2B5W4_DIPCM|nr:hypothetical protein O6H91_17G039800 [Diphasiastrum complanatum]